MRLFELLEYHEFTPSEFDEGLRDIPKSLHFLFKQKFESYKDITTELRRRGFNRKGSGSFASVFGKSGHKYIIKVTRIRDRAAERFFKVAMKQKPKSIEKHFPDIPVLQIVPITLYTPEGKRQRIKLLITAIEVLEGVTSKNAKRIPYDQRLGFLTAFVETPGEHHAFLGDFEHYFGIHPDSMDVETGRKSSTYHALMYAIKHVHSTDSLDLHAGNIMIRSGTNDLVISDPYVNDEDLDAAGV